MPGRFEFDEAEMVAIHQEWTSVSDDIRVMLSDTKDLLLLAAPAHEHASDAMAREVAGSLQGYRNCVGELVNYARSYQLKLEAVMAQYGLDDQGVIDDLRRRG